MAATVRLGDIEKDCFTPRDYQVELFDRACNRNTIVQLGTGAGKTFIAVLLVKHYATQLYAPLDSGGKRVFFVVHQVALVKQQAEHIRCHTTLTVEEVHGNLNIEATTSKSAFDEFIAQNQVIVLTAQVFLDILDHAFFDLSKTALLVFDECHHAMGVKHPYRVIMDRYERTSPDDRPRILGLTASLINESTPPALLEEKLKKLEHILNCNIESASDLVTVSKFMTKPKEIVFKCQDYAWDCERNRKAVETLLRVKEFCQDTTVFHKDLDIDPRKSIVESVNRTLAVLKQIGPWSAWKVAQVWEKQLRKVTTQPLLGSDQINFLRMGETAMMIVRRLFDREMKLVRSLDSLKTTLPDRVAKLLLVLSAYSPVSQKERQVDEPLCGIILVDQRYVAYSLNLLLKALTRWEPTKFGHLKTDFVIGFSGSSFASEESQGLHKRQEEVLRKFRRGDLNLLVATSVLEEGVDVRHCNLVVRFDRPNTYRSYVQSRGRARKPGASFAILVEEKDAAQCIEDVKNYEAMEKIMLKRYRTVHNPSEEAPEDNVDILVEPYIVPQTGAMVTMSTAISLINRYCAKLPSDIFTRLVPQNRIIVDTLPNGEKRYTAELLLPINAPVKEPIRCEPMTSKKLALMAVALEGCKILHKKGELNDQLMPVGKDAVANILTQFDDDPDEWVPDLDGKVGSAKRKQLYDKKMARVLHDALPKVGEPCYVYVMELELVKELTPEANPKGRKFVDPKNNECCFGFVSSVKLPKIPAFPAYLRQGDMRMSLVEASSTLTLDSNSFIQLQAFHHYLFNNVLLLCKGSLDFLLGPGTPVNTLIVPLRKVRLHGGLTDYKLDMKYVNEVVSSVADLPRIPSDEERKNYKFRPEDYRDRIVMPWYRNTDQPVFYYVAEIMEDLRPTSKFPDAEYSTFNEYFVKKYNIQIYDQEQNLLDVDYTSNRLNVLLGRSRPRAKERKAGELTSQRQILVPELVTTHPLSALFPLVSALPSFFYRVNALLLADELRVKIVEALSKDAQGWIANPGDDFEWSPLVYPSNQEEKEETTISKIQQIRKQNKERENKLDTVAINEDAFEIGVWNPELVADLIPSNDVSAQRQNGDTSSIFGEETDTIGLMGATELRSTGDLSDDEDEDAVVLFDFARTLSDQLTRLSGGTDIFAPREDIVESGWDAEVITHGDSNKAFVLTSAPEIDVQSLLLDLEGVFPAPVSSTQPTQEPAPKPRATTVPKPTQSQLLPKAPLPISSTDFDLFADELLEDREKQTREECVNLVELDDDSSPKGATSSYSLDDLKSLDFSKSTVSTQSDSSLFTAQTSSDDEAEILEKGEKEKTRKDEMAIAYQTINFEEASPKVNWEKFSFVKCPSARYGVSPCLLLTALTTSNASDGMNLERLETIGDSFLKFAVTDYLYHSHPDQHEGKLSFARSKEVSNCNLYRLGKRIGIPSLIVGSKFDVQDGWLPPCYVPIDDFKAPNSEDAEEKDKIMENVLDGQANVEQSIRLQTGWDKAVAESNVRKVANGVETIDFPVPKPAAVAVGEELSPLPYNRITQQYISDKSIADAVEALIGAHVLSLGPQPTLKFMKWLGLKVLTETVEIERPLLHFIDTPQAPNAAQTQLEVFWLRFNFANLEEKIGYRFHDKAFLLQAFTHASYYKNRITGCYQRLEFLGDAILDYMITRFLFEHERQYSPGVLTDLRSALVNNTIFASLAVKYEFHKHFVAMCPGLHHMIEKFVNLCKERNFFGANFNAEMYMVTTEEEFDEGQEEDIEVPKAMGDIFESVAGAIYLDSNRNLDVVWKVFYGLMKETIDECCANPPRSPIRELLELEPDRVRFSKLERIMETGKVRVTVEVRGRLRFTGMGRNYRIAKATAAKRALKYLSKMEYERAKENGKM